MEKLAQLGTSSLDTDDVKNPWGSRILQANHLTSFLFYFFLKRHHKPKSIWELFCFFALKK